MLGRALSRYNGLTNSAKLELITYIITGDGETTDFFVDKPFRYAHEIMQEFEKNIRPRSAEVLMQHAISFGFLHRATPGGTRVHPKLKKRVESTSHIALTPLGRALRSSTTLKHFKEKEFRLFLWEYALLECDFDLYALLIKMAEENNGELVEIDSFYSKYEEIREKKYEWIKHNFQYIPQLDSIKKHLKWFGGRARSHNIRWKWGDKLPKFEGQTKSHHYGQRKRWAKKFKHVDDSQTYLTERGRYLASCLPTIDAKPFFWLGPPDDIARSQFLASTEIATSRSFSPAWNLLRPIPGNKIPSTDPQFVEFVNDMASYMKDSFFRMRLPDFTQAPLEAAVPYVYFLERKYSQRVDERELFEAIFKQHRENFVCTLRGNLSQSHYWLRT